MVTIRYIGIFPNLIGFTTQISCYQVDDRFVCPEAIDTIKTALILKNIPFDANTFMTDDSNGRTFLTNWRVCQSN